MIIAVPFAKFENIWHRMGAATLIIAFAAAVGGLATLIPTFPNPYVNFLGFPGLIIALVFYLAFRASQSRENTR